MSKKTFLTIVAFVAFAIGFLALVFPTQLIVNVKMAAVSESAVVMARTVGTLLLTFSVLNFLVRNDADSATLRSVFIANLVLQLGLLPIDPIAYYTGVYATWGSFVPNTILHIILAGGFAYYLAQMKDSQLG